MLTASQRQRVIEMIDAETGFGLFIDKIAVALDEAQAANNGPSPVRLESWLLPQRRQDRRNFAEDERKVREMFEEVKAWIASRYVGYPIEIAPLFSKFRFNVNRASGAETYGSTGDIQFGIGVVRSKMEYYSLLLHELRHAVGFAWRATAPINRRSSPIWEQLWKGREWRQKSCYSGHFSSRS